jgi:hypothetical protein
VPLTPAMLEIQTAVLDLMNFTVKELKHINQTVSAISVVHIKQVIVVPWYRVPMSHVKF